jgi:UDP-N-acetylmuramoyl-tripeptide--D-alanyl-D-alanine ligase
MTIENLHALFVNSKGISTDTRKLEPDTIFFALKGANFNGNEFASKALEQGCTYAIIDEEEYVSDDRCILVDNVLKTLQDLSTHHRRQFNIPVLGITGSNGKTTTKELIGSVLAKKYNLLITEGNYNNHLGVPFTLLRMTSDHEFAVIEMGANKLGDIQELCEIAEPDFGLITNIGSAHLEGMGSIEGIIETKTALYRWVEKVGGLVFHNDNDPVLRKRLPKTDLRSYGDNGDIRGELVKVDPFITFKWSKEGYASGEIQTNLVGSYNFNNFLSAVVIGDHFGVKEEDICTALAEYSPSNNRSQVTRTKRNTLIVDCYNANPTSMEAAVDSFLDIDFPNERKILILGDMLELGDVSEAEHQAMFDKVIQNFDNSIFVGAEFLKISGANRIYKNFEEVIEKEKLSSIEDSLILLKGSRGIKLENLISHL